MDQNTDYNKAIEKLEELVAKQDKLISAQEELISGLEKVIDELRQRPVNTQKPKKR